MIKDSSLAGAHARYIGFFNDSAELIIIFLAKGFEVLSFDITFCLCHCLLSIYHFIYELSYTLLLEGDIGCSTKEIHDILELCQRHILHSGNFAISDLLELVCIRSLLVVTDH